MTNQYSNLLENFCLPEWLFKILFLKTQNKPVSNSNYSTERCFLILNMSKILYFANMQHDPIIMSGNNPFQEHGIHIPTVCRTEFFKLCSSMWMCYHPPPLEHTCYYFDTFIWYTILTDRPWDTSLTNCRVHLLLQGLWVSLQWAFWKQKMYVLIILNVYFLREIKKQRIYC